MPPGWHVATDLALAVWHFVTNVTFWQYTAISWLAFLASMLLVDRFENSRRRLSSTSSAVGGGNLFIWFIVAISKAITYVPTAYKAIIKPLAPSLGLPLVFLFLTAIGVALFVFRTKARVHYGMAETGFALATMWVSINAVFQRPELPTAWTGMTAAAYLLVRGLDNATFGLNVQSVIRLLRLRYLSFRSPKPILRHVPGGLAVTSRTWKRTRRTRSKTGSVTARHRACPPASS